MSKIELEYGNDMTITHKVEVFLADVAPDDEVGFAGFTQIVDDFSDYLEEYGLSEYWGSSYDVCPVFMGGLFCASLGLKFTFVRLISKKSKTLNSAMGEGTQWVNNVATLMTEFLVCAKKMDESHETEIYSDARLIFREGDQQFEWK